MSVIYRYRVTLEGWTGGPGVNTFFALGFEEGEANETALNNFGKGLHDVYNTTKDLMVGMTIRWDGSVDVLNIADAALVDRTGGLDDWALNPPAGQPGNVSRATQAKLQFKTDKIRNRRFLNGGIFFGPLNATAIDGAGQIGGTPRARLVDVWGGLLDILGLRLAVYGQPTRPDVPPGPGQPPNNADGVAGYVQNIGVKGAPAVLRRRRD